MEKIFLSVLNMSLTASFVIAAIMLARLPLKKAPKIISYALWAVAGFRLVFPFTLEGVFSLLPFKSAPIPADIATQAIPRIDSGIAALDNAVSAVLPAAAPAASVNPLQICLMAGAVVWLIGIAVMVAYSIVSIILLKKQLRGATLLEDNLYEVGNLKTPFVIGLFCPKIYIPAGLSGEERKYIILHEQTHIRRCDHAVKMFAYFVLCLHWFNPFAWAAFLLMGADMEMSCDERVLREMGDGTKKAYSTSLLSLATERRIIGLSPLAFGEGGMKERIKNVLNFKKPSRLVIIAAVALAIGLTAGLSVNRAGKGTGDMDELTVKLSDDKSLLLTLPDGFTISDSANPNSRFAPLGKFVLNSTGFEQRSILNRDGEAVGAVSLAYVVNTQDFRDSGGNPRALYQGIMLGSGYRWDNYASVYESDDGNSGAATAYVVYTKDFLQNLREIDLEHMGVWEDDPAAFINKGVLAYNLDAGCYAAVEMNFDGLDDQQWIRLAKNLRIVAMEAAAPEVTATQVTLYHYSGDPAKPFGPPLSQSGAESEVQIPGTVAMQIHYPKSTVKLSLYCRPITGNPALLRTADFTVKNERAGVTPDIRNPDGFVWDVANQFPYGFNGTIWAEAESAGDNMFPDGIKPKSDVIKAIYRADERRALPYPAPTDSVRFFVTASPGRYALAMSSTPGLRLDITYEGPPAQIRYEAETGGFISWENSVIRDLGSSPTRPYGADALYWRPNPDAPQDDSITLTVLNEAGEKPAECSFEITEGTDGFFTAFLKPSPNG